MLVAGVSRLAVVLSLLPWFVGCGVTIKEKEPEKVIPEFVGNDAFAEQYFLEDNACHQGNGIGTVGETPVHIWQGNATESVGFMFKDVSSVNSLENPIIGRTYYGFHQKRLCEQTDAKLQCQEKATIVTVQQSLKICRPNGPYDRFSVEGVALSSLANIVTAYDYYRSLPNKSPNMEKASLLVLPTIEKVINTRNASGDMVLQRRLSTDNLAYAPSFGGEPAFVIFPKGKKAEQAGLWPDLNLWEIPWALAHEFGHHVFRTHTNVTEISNSKTMATNFSGDFYQISDLDGHLHGGSDQHLDDHLDGQKLLAERTVGNTEVWGVVNEGFADLFAYYVQDAKSGAIENIDCFESNREVAKSDFSNGKRKILSQEVLELFYASEKNEQAGCSKINFQDVHFIGAIVAFGIDQIFSQEVGGTTGKENAKAKGRLLLEWANSMGELVKKTEDLRIEDLLATALRVVAPDGQLGLDQCESIREVFPGYAGPWLAGDFHCQQ